MALALFDLDHTLLDGDSDVLWCDYLLREGVLDAGFAARNRAMEAQYQAGTVSAVEFCAFYVSTLAGRSVADWQAHRERYLREVIVPRITPAAVALVQRHRDAGDTLVLTTATNRVLTELTAQFLRVPHLIATECEVGSDGRLTGKPTGILNMREGKVTRLHGWLAEQGLPREAMRDATAYSDSINDLPLLRAAGRAVVVNPDAKLRALADTAGWPSTNTRATTPHA